MNTPWWFRLYTLHTLKFFAKVTACQFALYAVLAFLGGVYAKMSGFVVLLAPALYFISHNTNHFRQNIEFHKMSIPFPELKRAFFSDIAIKQVMFAILFLLNLYIAVEVSGGMKLASEFMFLTPSQLIYFVPMYFFGSASVMTFYKETKYIFVQKHKNAVINLFLFCMLIVSGGILVAFLVTSGYQVPFLAVFGVSAFTTGVLFFRSKAIFHQFRPVGRIRDAVKFTSLGTAICLCFYFLAVMVGRNDVLETKYSAVQRVSGLTFAGPFSPGLDKETFVSIERYVDAEDQPLLYKKADFPVASLGLEYFLDNDPSLRRLRSVLEYTKPEPTFLSALYDHFEDHPEYWKEKYSELNFKAFAYSRWPAKSLPENYALAKANNENAIEARKEQRRKNREIASKKRSR